jgi:hypothetical protein
VKDGYPEESELEKIKQWPKMDFEGLYDYIEELWYYPDYIKKEGHNIEMHTGGWSGNEEIISAFQTTFFWFLSWKRIDRGGHYYLEVPGNVEFNNGN